MSFKPCIIIPIYNHGASISSTLQGLLPYGLPIFIVDDGSAEATKKVLEELAAQHASIRLLQLPQNSGKGAAVIHGLRQARQEGFSHALQIDADGQHDTRDVPRFLAAGAAHPEDVISGKPIYDASVPKGRLYGRYITHFWVWVETLSFNIQDSMCGFRLYPLLTTAQLIDSVTLPQRMDFDTAIAVRLFWRKVRFQNIPTRVIYPADGISHFQMWRDNLRISKMHTLLTCGMLLRLPVLLWHKLSPTATARDHWSKISERGCALGLRITVCIYRLLGKRAARLLLYPIVAYFFLTGGKARRASRDYLQRVHAFRAQPGPTPGWRTCFRHMMTFAQSGLDKFGAWMGKEDETPISFANREELDQLIASKRGAVLIGSHLGNLEMTRAMATQAHHVTINAVVYTDHAQKFNQVLATSNMAFGVNLLQVSHFGTDTAILLKDKIDRGELLVIVGDRTPPADNGRVEDVMFLGEPAPFAQGPFILASLLECPVYLFFCLREQDGYHIYLEAFADKIELPRKERQARLKSTMQQYAHRLETYCLKAPDQWFNFYDFWQKKPNAETHQPSSIDNKHR